MKLKLPTFHLSVVIVLLFAGLFSGTPLRAANPLPLGTAIVTKITCPPGGVAGTVCYSLQISCPQENIADTTATLKVIQPKGTSIGTVTFASGGGDTAFYDTVYTYGATTVQDVVSAGYIAVEIEFTNNTSGWLTGPGGPLNLACRYATANQWIYNNIHQGGSTQPMCATGNSGGGGAIGYALAQYGLGSIFAMVEPTSGPVFSRVDNGCICNQPPLSTPCAEGLQSECYGVTTAQEFIDPAYATVWCSRSVTSHNKTYQTTFFNDSIDSPTATYFYPTTDVHVVFGGQDFSSAVPQGSDWVNLITTKKTIECVADAPHDLPNVLDGAQKVASDLQTYCKLQVQAWEQVPGLLSGIALGSAVSVWGLNGAGQIYWCNPQTQSWSQIAGQLAQIAVASDGTVWGINSGQQIFRFNPQTQGWDHIAGALTQIAVGSAGVVWGINSSQQIFRFDPGTQGWDQIPGSPTQISAAADGSVWGLNAQQQIFRFNLQTMGWDRIPGALTQIAIGADGAVWGINSAQEIFTYSPQTQGWNRIPGLLTHIGVGSATVVWGLNSAGEIFRYNSQTQGWDQIPGQLTQIAVAYDGSVWGINSAQQIFTYR